MASYGQVIGKWLRDAMAATGKTNKRALAKAAEVDRSNIYLILKDKGNPGWETVAALASALGVDPPDFALGTLQEPSDVSGWVGQAQNALGQAQRILERQATAPPGGKNAPAAIVKGTKDARKKAARRPRGDQPEKAG